MGHKLPAKDAFRIIRDKLIPDLDLQSLEKPDRTYVRSFAAPGENGRQFILELGKSMEAAQTIITTEKLSALPDIPGVASSAARNNSRLTQKKTWSGHENRLRLANQSFLVDDSSALETLIRWYILGNIENVADKNQEPDDEQPSERIKLSQNEPASNEEDQCLDILAIANSSNNSTTKEQLVKARLGQGKFRDNVIKTWGLGNACAVTGMNIQQLLVASHIIPWRESDDCQRLDGTNGILLCAHLDKLFDRYLISFDDKGLLVSSHRLTATDWTHLETAGLRRSMRLNVEELVDKDIHGIAKNLRVHRQRLTDLDNDRAREH